MSECSGRRWGRIGVGVCIVAIFLSTAYLAYRIVIVGLTAEQQQAADQFSHQPLKTLSDPLFALLVSTALVAAITASLLCYHWYAQWRYAHFERLAFENELYDEYE